MLTASSIVQVISCADRPTCRCSVAASIFELVGLVSPIDIGLGLLADDLGLVGLFALFTMEMIKRSILLGVHCTL